MVRISSSNSDQKENCEPEKEDCGKLFNQTLAAVKKRRKAKASACRSVQHDLEQLAALVLIWDQRPILFFWRKDTHNGRKQLRNLFDVMDNCFDFRACSLGCLDLWNGDVHHFGWSCVDYSLSRFRCGFDASHDGKRGAGRAERIEKWRRKRRIVRN